MSAPLSEGERRKAAAEARRGRVPAQTFARLPLLTDVRGRHLALGAVPGPGVTSCRLGHRDGVRLHSGRRVFVLADVTAERFGFRDTAGLVAWLDAMSVRKGYRYVPFEDALRGETGR